MVRTDIKPNTAAAMILQALRAGPMEPGQIGARWPGCSSVISSLMKQGFITVGGPRFGQSYRITETGRAACPARRSRIDERTSHAQE